MKKEYQLAPGMEKVPCYEAEFRIESFGSQDDLFATIPNVSQIIQYAKNATTTYLIIDHMFLYGWLGHTDVRWLWVWSHDPKRRIPGSR